MSVDMERASDFDSVAQADDLQRAFHSSRLDTSLSGGYDRTLQLVRSLLEAGHWDSILPRHEKQVLLAATHNERSWHHFLDSCGSSSQSAHSSAGSSTAQSHAPPTSGRRSAASAAAKVQKAVSRPKRGTTTPRRRGADTDSGEPAASDSTQDTVSTSKEHIETLHTRLRTMISDVLIDEVLFPHEKHPEQIPLPDIAKQSTFP